MKIFTAACAGALMFSLLAAPEVKAQSTTDTIMNVIGAVANNRSNRGYYGNGYGYGNSVYGNSVYGNSIYGNQYYGNNYPGVYRGYSSYGNYGQVRPYGYRTFRSNPYRGYNYVDEGDYRNYRDEYGNFIGRVPLSSL